MTRCAARWRPLTTPVALVLLVAACGSSPTPSPSVVASASPSAGASATTPPGASATRSRQRASRHGTSKPHPTRASASSFRARHRAEDSDRPDRAGTITLHQGVVANAFGLYVVSWGDYPTGSVTDPNLTLAAVRNGAVKTVAGKVTADNDVTRSGLAGRDFTAAVTGGTYRSEIFLRGERLIQLAVLTGAGAQGFDPERFFGSLKLG